MWEHYDDLPFEVFCVDSKGERHLIKRHRLESEAIHTMNIQNRSGGYSAEYWNWMQVELEKGSSNMVTPVDAVLSQPHGVNDEPVVTVMKSREIRCMLCNDCGMTQPCPGCQKVDPYLKAYGNSLVNDETGDPHS
jgi:hypothetical protein